MFYGNGYVCLSREHFPHPAFEKPKRVDEILMEGTGRNIGGMKGKGWMRTAVSEQALWEVVTSLSLCIWGMSVSGWGMFPLPSIIIAF